MTITSTLSAQRAPEWPPGAKVASVSRVAHPRHSVSARLALAREDILVHPVLSLSLSWEQPFLQGAWFLLVRMTFRN